MYVLMKYSEIYNFGYYNTNIYNFDFNEMITLIFLWKGIGVLQFLADDTETKAVPSIDKIKINLFSTLVGMELCY